MNKLNIKHKISVVIRIKWFLIHIKAFRFFSVNRQWSPLKYEVSIVCMKTGVDVGICMYDK